MDYGRIIKRSLEITWRNKVLWIFGIAATLFGAGGGGGSGAGNNLFQYSFNKQDMGPGVAHRCRIDFSFFHLSDFFG